MKINTLFQGFIYVADPSTTPPTPVTGLVDGDFTKLVVVNNVYVAVPLLVVEQVDAVNAAGVYRWAYLTTDLGICRLEIGYAPLDLKFVGEYPVTTYDLDDSALEVTLVAHEASQDTHRTENANQLDIIEGKVDLIPTAGEGSVSVNHNTGGTDNLRITDASDIAIDNAHLYVYLKSDWDAGNRGSSYIKAQSITDINGRWEYPIRLDPGTYTLSVEKSGYEQEIIKEFTVS